MTSVVVGAHAKILPDPSRRAARNRIAAPSLMLREHKFPMLWDLMTRLWLSLSRQKPVLLRKSEQVMAI
jgi:hypothetical protein